MNDIEMHQTESDYEEQEPDFSDPDGYIDEVDDEDLMSDVLTTKPKENDGLENVIVVDNIPKVDQNRFEKLRKVVTALFSRSGQIVKLEFPLDENKNTLGYAFVEYASRDEAVESRKGLDGHRMDKNHVFVANFFSDIEKYSQITEDWTPPEPQPYVDRGNLKSWLLNVDCQDQYSVIHDCGSTVTIFQNSNPEDKVIRTRENWTENNLLWSPQGSYLVTYHKKGVALWGGETFEQLNRFPHDGVSVVDFSTQENYLVSFSASLANFDDPNAFIIWDIMTGSKKRCFGVDKSNVLWPVFKWSKDDKYFARMTTDTLSIFETPSMSMLGKKSVKVPGIKNFSWSPKQNILAYWVAETKDQPARVTLIEVPSRREIRSKNLFNVADCRLHWQKSGDYLCVKVDRYGKKVNKDKDKDKPMYSGLYYNFEVFHMKEKEVPVDSVEIKENIVAFAWEPVGNKFAIIHGDGPQNYNISFYGIKSGTSVFLLKKYEGKQCNTLFWSPTGQFIVLAGLRSSHILEFIDTSDFTVTQTQEHFMCTEVEWDPTGRYVMTGISYWVHRSDNSFNLWTFQGRLIRKVTLDGFCQLMWRPRPPTLLDEKKIKDVKKNLKKYSPQFDMKDRMAQSRVSEEILTKRKDQMAEFREFRDKCDQIAASTLSKRNELRPASDLSHEETYEETIEFFTKEEITIVEE